MLRLGLLVALACGVSNAYSLGRRAGYAVKETIGLPRGWEEVGLPASDEQLVFSIGLKQSNFEELEKQLYEVSDPVHSKYGQHLTIDKVTELVKPTEKTIKAVHDWLALHDVSLDKLGYSPSGDWINLRMSVKDAETLLDTKFSRYRHVDGDEVIRTLEYSIPRSLHRHVDTIQPTNSFSRPKKLRTTVRMASTATTTVEVSPNAAFASYPAVCTPDRITINCLRTLYNTIDYKPKALPGSKVSLNDFLGEVNLRSDVKLDIAKYRPDLDANTVANSFDQISINGGTTQQTPLTPAQVAAGTGFEGDLDIETMLGITYPLHTTIYSTGGSPPYIPDYSEPTQNFNEPYLTWTQYLAGVSDADLPTVVSTSYDDDEQTVPKDYANRVCQSFAVLGARGVSLFFASGDDGVGALPCTSNDGKNTTMFIPEFPSTCPYITSVGATKLIANSTDPNQPEVVAYDPGNGFSGGGGFSNYFSRPFYQDLAVPQYVSSLGKQYAGLYNPNGRAIPDLTANGQGYEVFWDNINYRADGTSASTPTTASIFGLVNDALIANGRPRLGFINPWLYTIGQAAFTDVTEGSTLGCGTNGFPAQKGWDAASGFGTPNFKKILTLLGIFDGFP